MQGAHAQNLATILQSLFNSAGGVSERLLRSTSLQYIFIHNQRKKKMA